MMDKLQDFLSDKYSLGMECKGKSREYEFSYEGTLSKNADDLIAKLHSNVHGVGDTLSEFIKNVTNQSFILESEDELIKKYLNLYWNIYLTIEKDMLKISAKHLQTDEECSGEGVHLKTLLEETLGK
jgi:hypothetical protein